jgi:hypothetical protein
LARTRLVQRGIADPERQAYHGSVIPNTTYESPQLAVPILTVDTSNGYRPSFEQIMEFARQPAKKAGGGLRPE